MQSRLFFAALMALFVISAPAQNTFPASGPAGVGTTNPSSLFQIWGGDEMVTGTDLNGTAYITSRAGVAYYGNNIYSNGIAINPTGQVGIGTANPRATLHITAPTLSEFSGSDMSAIGSNLVLDGTASGRTIGQGTSLTFAFTSVTNAADDQIHWEQARILATPDNTANNNSDGRLYLQVRDQYNPPGIGGTWNWRTGLMIQANGNTGIGTTSPGATLEVNGDVKLTSGSGASMTFADGTTQSTAWTGTLSGGDYAESVDVTGERAQYEPGDVLVIDPAHPGQFLKSTTRYSRLVAGIYSTKPGLVGRRQTTDPKLSSTEVPMAMVGIVPIKVTDENGPIEVGDLLVTSSLSAHAMTGGDGALPTGTVIGKALGSLASGTGVIDVLVSLQ